MTTGTTSISPDQEMKSAIRRRFAQIGVMVLVYALSLFLSAGRWDWLEGWLFIGLYLVGIGFNALWMKREVIAERSRVGQGTKTWDLYVAGVTMLLMAPGSLIMAGLDERFGWSSELSPAVWIGGLVVFFVGLALVDWAIASNPFFSTTVRIQAERGHTVVTGGAYRLVRHPAYTGWMLSAVGTALLLRSYWALIPVGLSSVGLVIRTVLEDRTLLAELPGYADYAEQTRYRLLPGIW